jgi:hypothetical protein
VGEREPHWHGKSEYERTVGISVAYSTFSFSCLPLEHVACHSYRDGIGLSLIRRHGIGNRKNITFLTEGGTGQSISGVLLGFRDSSLF